LIALFLATTMLWETLTRMYAIGLSAQKLSEISDKRAIEPLKEALAKEQDADTKKAMEYVLGNEVYE